MSGAAAEPMDPRTTDAVARHRLPFPLAALYRQVNTSHEASARFCFSLLLVEGVIRFLALVNIADAAGQGAPRKRLEKWLRQLEHPGMGTLLGMLRSACRFLADVGGPFVEECAPLLGDGASWDAAASALVEVRNRFAHDRVHVSNADGTRLLNETEAPRRELLHHLLFLQHYQLGVAQALRSYGSGGFGYYWYASRGLEETCEPVQLRGSRQMIENAVVLLDPRSDHGLYLAPFLCRATGSGDRAQHLLWLHDRTRTDAGESLWRYRHPVLRQEASQGLYDPDRPEGQGIDTKEYLNRLEQGSWPTRLKLGLAEEAQSKLLPLPAPGRLGEGAMARLPSQRFSKETSAEAAHTDKRSRRVPLAVWIGLATVLGISGVLIFFAGDHRAITALEQGSATSQPPATRSSESAKPGDIRDLMVTIQPGVRDCYNAALKQEKEVEGEIHFAIRFDSAGHVTQVRATRDSLGIPAVAACIMSQLKTLKGPPSLSDRTVSYPFRFSQPRTLTVMPFHKISGGPKLNWLQGGIAETISAKLGQLPKVILVERVEIQKAFKRLSPKERATPGLKPIATAARAVGVLRLIVGAFQKMGAQIRITARLVRTTDGRVLSTAVVTGEMKEIFKLQDELARKLAGGMNISGAYQALGRQKEKSLEILELLGKATNALEGIGEPVDTGKAATLFRQVIAIDPSIPEAYLGLAESLWKPSIGDPAEEETYSKIHDALERAIELRPNSYQAISFMGNLLWKKRRFDEAFEMQRKAAMVKPRYAPAYFGLGDGYATKGKADEALAMIGRAIEIDPRNSEYTTLYGTLVGVFKRDFKKALTHTEAATRLDNVSEWTWLMHGYAQLMSGDFGGCLASIEKGKALRQSPDDMDMKVENMHAGLSTCIEAACKIKRGDLGGGRAVLSRLPASMLAYLRRGPTKDYPTYAAIVVDDVRKILLPLMKGSSFQ